MNPGHICTHCSTPDQLRWQVHNAISHDGPCEKCGRHFKITRTIDPGQDLPGRTVSEQWSANEMEGFRLRRGAGRLLWINRPWCWITGHQWATAGGWVYCRRCNWVDWQQYRPAPKPTGPEFDADGYPTETTLDRIRTWPLNEPGLWDFVKQCWQYPDCFRRDPGGITLITLGWSGNENIVQALRDNTVFHSLCWQSSERGGTHRYNVLHELWPDSVVCSSPEKPKH